MFIVFKDYKELKKSNTQTVIVSDTNTLTSEENDYFIIPGEGVKEINEKNHCLNLINPNDNDVYLKYDIYLNDKLIKQTDLISPGMMERFDVYDSFDKGEYLLEYFISTYDLETKELYWKDINVKQEIIVT